MKTKDLKTTNRYSTMLSYLISLVEKGGVFPVGKGSVFPVWKGGIFPAGKGGVFPVGKGSVSPVWKGGVFRVGKGGVFPGGKGREYRYLVSGGVGVPERVAQQLAGAGARVHQLELHAGLGHGAEGRGLPVRLSALLPHHYVETRAVLVTVGVECFFFFNF